MDKELIVQNQSESDHEFDRNFKPSGAMVFFALLIVLCLIIWYSIYFLMLERV